MNHIFPKTLINDNRLSAIISYFLVARSNASGLMIVRIRNKDFGNREEESTTMLSRDLALPKHRVMYNYEYRAFTTFLFGKTLLASENNNFDILIIIDVLNDTTIGIPFIQKRATGVFVVVTEQQPSSQIHLANEPQSVVLTNFKEEIIVQSASNDACGIVVTNAPVVWKKINGEFFKLPSDIREIQAKDRKYYTEDHKYSCAVGLLLNTYGFMEDQSTILKYVQSHPTYELLSIILSTMNTRLLVNIRTPEMNIAYSEWSHLHYLRFIYNDLYWYDTEDNGMFGKISADTLVCLGTEDVVWIVVNPAEKVFNWNTVVITVVGAASTLLASFLLEHATGYKYPLQMTVILMWSVFLTVSVPKQPQNYFYRVLFFSWTLSSSVITLCYYYKLFNALSSPSISRYQTSEELSEAYVLVLTYELKYINLAFQWNTTFLDRESIRPDKGPKKHLLELIQQYTEDGTEFALVVDSKYLPRVLAVIGDAQYYNLLQKVTRYPDCFYSTYADHLTSYVRKKTALLAAAGIVEKTRASRYIKPNGESSLPSKIKLRYLLNIYILVGILYCIAIVIFIAEIIVFRYKNKTPSNYLQQKHK